MLHYGDIVVDVSYVSHIWYHEKDKVIVIFINKYPAVQLTNVGERELENIRGQVHGKVAIGIH